MFPSWNARAVGLSLSAEATIELAAGAGFCGVDLLVRDVVESGTDPAELRQRMDDLGLQGGAWPLPVNWRGDAGTFSDDLARLATYCRAAATLGLYRTGTWVLPESIPGSIVGAQDHEVIRQTVEFHLDRLGRIARILADHGNRLGLEIIGPASARSDRGVPFISRYVDLAEYLDELKAKHPNLGVLVDAFHLYAAGEGPEEGLVWGGDVVVWVHVADPAKANRTVLLDQEQALPGETGLVDCRELLAHLRDQGYSGPVIAEPLGQCRSLKNLDPLGAARRTLASLRSIWPGNQTNPKRSGQVRDG
jgi:sugar phosphate isomerase/epimerase